MKTQYSPAQRENYGRQLAAHLCDQHFGARPTATLDGPAVLAFTPVRQLNLFVVQALLGQWTAETTRLRSPYFDFEDADVRQALTQFMNVLSRRIRLSRPAFEPLLAQAATDALAGALDPAATLATRLLPPEGETRTAAQLREALRYFDSRKTLFTSFADTLEPAQPYSRTELLSRFARYAASPPEPDHELLNQLSALRPLPAAEVPAPAAPAIAAAAPPATTPASAPATTPPAAPKPAAEAADPAAPVPLYAKLKAEHAGAPSLSETLRTAERGPTLADKPRHVESLREAISINQRFSFINELFGGENMQYHAAIQHLDSLPDADAAKHYVTGELAAAHQWTRKEEHVNKLLRLIERKFSA